MGNVRIERRERVVVVTIDRPEVRNAVDRATAAELAEAFRSFESDDSLHVGVLTGAGGTFCSGADLIAMSRDPQLSNRVAPDGDAPMGPSRMMLDKPVIAAIEGHAVAGGMELALWCDLRVAADGATFGFFNRRFGVPLMDGGTVRLPRMIGHGRALDLILTGRAVHAPEAFAMGLVDRLTRPGLALSTAIELAAQIARFPQHSSRADRRSALRAWSPPESDALAAEFQSALEAVATGEAKTGADRFWRGEGRHGSFEV